MFKKLIKDIRHWIWNLIGWCVSVSGGRSQSERVTGLYDLSLAVVGSRAGIEAHIWWNELSIKRLRYRKIKPPVVWASGVCFKDKRMKSSVITVQLFTSDGGSHYWRATNQHKHQTALKPTCCQDASLSCMWSTLCNRLSTVRLD